MRTHIRILQDIHLCMWIQYVYVYAYVYIYIYIYINAGLSGIRSVRYWNDKK